MNFHDFLEWIPIGITELGSGSGQKPVLVEAKADKTFYSTFIGDRCFRFLPFKEVRDACESLVKRKNNKTEGAKIWVCTAIEKCVQIKPNIWGIVDRDFPRKHDKRQDNPRLAITDASDLETTAICVYPKSIKDFLDWFSKGKLGASYIDHCVLSAYCNSAKLFLIRTIVSRSFGKQKKLFSIAFYLTQTINNSKDCYYLFKNANTDDCVLTIEDYFETQSRLLNDSEKRDLGTIKDKFISEFKEDWASKKGIDKTPFLSEGDFKESLPRWRNCRGHDFFWFLERVLCIDHSQNLNKAYLDFVTKDGDWDSDSKAAFQKAYRYTDLFRKVSAF